MRVYGYFATTRGEEEQQRRDASPSRRSELLQQATEAFEQERWGESAKFYGQLVDDNPRNVQALYRYAMSLHQNGDLQQAHNAWMRLCNFRQGRRFALYNIACIYALQNEKQLALDYLQEAVDAGYENRSPIGEDPDFASLVDDPEFRRLEELAKPIGMRDTYRRFDFLKGNWLLRTPEGQLVGRFDVTTENHGYTLIGRLTNNSTSRNATIVSYYEPGAERWKQVWIDDDGTVTQLEHVDSDESRLVLEGAMITAEGEHQQARVVYAEDDEGVTSQSLFRSRDGADWETVLTVQLESRGSRKRSFLDMPPGR